ncbi:hypothetical protein D3C85_1187550 [compost metagenome]
MRGQHRRGIGANAEERRAGKVGHAGEAKLHRQPQAGGGVQQHRAQHQQDKMAFVEQHDQRERARHRPQPRQPGPPGSRLLYGPRDLEPACDDRRCDGQRQQRGHGNLRFRVQEQIEIGHDDDGRDAQHQGRTALLAARDNGGRWQWIRDVVRHVHWLSPQSVRSV